MYAARPQLGPIKMGKLEMDDTNEYRFPYPLDFGLDIELGIPRYTMSVMLGRIDLIGHQDLIANVRVISGDTDTLFIPQNSNKKVIELTSYRQIIPKISNKMIKRMNKICRRVNPNRIGRRR